MRTLTPPLTDLTVWGSKTLLIVVGRAQESPGLQASEPTEVSQSAAQQPNFNKSIEQPSEANSGVSNGLHFRLLKFKRPSVHGHNNLLLSADPKTYTAAEIDAYLAGLPDKCTKLAEHAICLFGCIQLAEAYYLLAVPSARIVGSLHGHLIYEITEKPLILQVNYRSRSTIDETRYKLLLQNFDMSSGFYFSSTYDLTSSFQNNATERAVDKESHTMTLQDMYCWNYFAMSSILRYCPKETWNDWMVPIIHGVVHLRELPLDGKNSLKLTLIARRSRHFAGTRYLRRGCDAEGSPANEVETEQIVTVEDGGTGFVRSSSLVQVRGSIPMYWSHTNYYAPSPWIALEKDSIGYPSAKSAFRRHFRNLFQRYGSHVTVVNLVRQQKANNREYEVGKTYKEWCLETRFSGFEEPIHRFYRSRSQSSSSTASASSDIASYLGNIVPLSNAWLNFIPSYLKSLGSAASDSLGATNSSGVVSENGVPFGQDENSIELSAKSAQKDLIGSENAIKKEGELFEQLEEEDDLVDDDIDCIKYTEYDFLAPSSSGTGGLKASEKSVFRDLTALAVASVHLNGFFVQPPTARIQSDNNQTTPPFLSFPFEQQPVARITESRISISSAPEAVQNLLYEHKASDEGELVAIMEDIQGDTVLITNLRNGDASNQEMESKRAKEKIASAEETRVTTGSENSSECVVGAGLPVGLLQRGVVRTNCIDCLDRTNIAQFCYAKVVLEKQCHSLGVELSSPGHSQLLILVMKAWAEHGDLLARQYAGSGAMHRVRKNMFSQSNVIVEQPLQVAAVPSQPEEISASALGLQEILADSSPVDKIESKVATRKESVGFAVADGASNAIVAVQRYAANISTDFERQQCIDLILGFFQVYFPPRNKKALWELDSSPAVTRFERVRKTRAFLRLHPELATLDDSSTVESSNWYLNCSHALRLNIMKANKISWLCEVQVSSNDKKTSASNNENGFWELFQSQRQKVEPVSFRPYPPILTKNILMDANSQRPIEKDGVADNLEALTNISLLENKITEASPSPSVPTDETSTVGSLDVAIPEIAIAESRSPEVLSPSIAVVSDIVESSEIKDNSSQPSPSGLGSNGRSRSAKKNVRFSEVSSHENVEKVTEISTETANGSTSTSAAAATTAPVENYLILQPFESIGKGLWNLLSAAPLQSDQSPSNEENVVPLP